MDAAPAGGVTVGGRSSGGPEHAELQPRRHMRRRRADHPRRADERPKKEADETFYLDLFGNSSNSLITTGRGIGTILNDD